MWLYSLKPRQLGLCQRCSACPITHACTHAYKHAHMCAHKTFLHTVPVHHACTHIYTAVRIFLATCQGSSAHTSLPCYAGKIRRLRFGKPTHEEVCSLLSGSALEELEIDSLIKSALVLEDGSAKVWLRLAYDEIVAGGAVLPSDRLLSSLCDRTVT